MHAAAFLAGFRYVHIKVYTDLQQKPVIHVNLRGKRCYYANIITCVWDMTAIGRAMEPDVSTADDGLRLDLGIRSAWQPQVKALFDFKVIDTDGPSHCSDTAC